MGTFVLSSCVLKKDGVIPKALVPKKVFQGAVTNITLVDNQFILTGTNLDKVVSAQIKDGSSVTNFAIEAKTATSLVLNAATAIKLSMNKVLSLILSDAYASATFDINFNLCTAKLGPSGQEKGFDCTLTVNDKDVLSYNAATGLWAPRSVNGINYVGTYDATLGVDPTNTSGSPTPAAGNYYLISNPGNIKVCMPGVSRPCDTGVVSVDYQNIAFGTGDWIAWSGDEWQKISNTRNVVSFNTRTGSIMPRSGDYNISLLGDVDLVTTPQLSGNLLKWNGISKWIPTTTIPDNMVVTNSIADNAVTAQEIADGAVTSSKILDGTILNADVNSAAAIAGSKIGALSTSALTAVRGSNVVNTDTLNQAIAKLMYLPTEYVSKSTGTTNDLYGTYQYNYVGSTVNVNTPLAVGTNVYEAANVNYVGAPWSYGSAFSTHAIRPSGKVGIGISIGSTPASLLELKSGSNDGITFSSVSGLFQGKLFNNSGTSFDIGSVSGHALNLLTNNSTRVTVDNVGRLGVGTTSPSGKLDVVSTGSQTVNLLGNGSSVSEINLGNSVGDASGRMQLGFTNNTGTPYGYWKTSSNSNPLVIQPSGGAVGIGTLTPSAVLDLVASTNSNPVARFSSTSSTSYGLDLKGGGGGTGRYLFRATTADGYQKLLLDENGKLGIGDNTNLVSTFSVKGSASVGSGYYALAAPTDGLIVQGNVGIGTTAPGAKLEVNAGSNDGVRINNGTVNGVVFNTNNSSMTVGTVSNHPLSLYTNNTNRLFIDASGNVGIGTSNPSSKFEVNDTNSLVTSRGTAGYGSFYAIGSGTNNSYFFLGNASHGEQGRVSASDGGILTFSNGNSATERMRIDGVGNVGIGTPSPNKKLTVTNPSGGGNLTPVEFSQGGQQGWGIGLVLRTIGTSNADGAALLFRNHDSKNWQIRGETSGNGFQINEDGGDNEYGASGFGTPRLHIAPGGNIGIGTSSPSAKLEVAGNVIVGEPFGGSGNQSITFKGANTDGAFVRFNSTSDAANGSNLEIGTIDNSDEPIIFTQSGSERMRIHTNGAVGIGNANPSHTLAVNGSIRGYGIYDYSDVRLKKDIKPLQDNLIKVLKLNAVSYFWKDAKREHINQIGFIAQEVEKIFPDLVKTDNEGNKSLNYSHFVAPLTEATKELYNMYKVTLEKVKEVSSRVKEHALKIASLEHSDQDQNRELASLKVENIKLKQENALKVKEMAELKNRMDRLEKALILK